jgi:arylsulfatase A-like enzyme
VQADAYVGLLLKKLEETGELENTLIVVSGDHGMPGDKRKMQPLRLLHGRTLLRWPRGIKGQSRWWTIW